MPEAGSQETSPQPGRRPSNSSGYPLYDVVVARESARIRELFDKALAEGDDSEAEKLGELQVQNGVTSDLQALLSGQDPLTHSSPENTFTHPIFEVQRQSFHVEQKIRAVSENVLSTPEWQQVNQWWAGIRKRYKDQNEATPTEMRPGMTQEEILGLQQRLQPVTVDPNELGEIRQTVVKLDQLMKEHSGGYYSMWTHPATKHIADFLNRETAIGTPGFLRSGQQELPAFTEYVARPFVMGMEAVGDPMWRAWLGAIGWYHEAVAAITGGQVEWEPPTNFVEMPDGSIVSNEGKVPSVLDMFVAMRATISGDDVAKAMAGWEAAKEHAEATSSGLGNIITGASQLAGTITAFAPTAAAGVGAANTIQKGLNYLGALGKVSKGGQATARARAILHLTQASGQAGAFAMQEAITAGSPDKLKEALAHGTQTGLVMYALGAMGKSVEFFARTRMKMPTKVAQGLGITAEALGFTALEFADMQGSMWEFLKDPTEHSWEAYSEAFMKNFLGLLLARGAGHGLGGQRTQAADLRQAASAARRVVGEQLRRFRSEGKEPPPETLRQIEAMGAKPEQLEQLSELAEKAREGDLEAGAERVKLELRLESQEAGVGRSEPEEVAADVERVRGATGESLASQRAERELLAREGPTPEARGRVTKMLRGARGWFAEQAGKLLRKEAPQGPPTRAERTTGTFERVEGKEPGVIREESLKQDRKRLTALEKRIESLRDPLEDPGFKQLPKAQQQRILAEKTLEGRKRITAEERGLVAEAEALREKVLKAEPSEAPEPVLGSFQAAKQATSGVEIPGTEPVRKSDIFARMEGFEGDPVRTPQRKGKIRFSKKIKGFFERNKDIIRFRGEEGWEFAGRAHEFSHSIQEAAVGLEGRVLPPEARAEGKKMLEGYESKRLNEEGRFQEVWAEYHARDLLGEAGMAEKFPALAKEFGPMLASRPQVLRQYGEVKALFERYRDQGSLKRGMAFVHALGDRPSLEALKAAAAEEGGAVRRALRTLDRAFFQNLEKLDWSMRQWMKIAKIDPSMVPITAHVLRTVEALKFTEAAKAASFMEHGVMRITGEKITRGAALKKAFENIKTPYQKRMLDTFLVFRKMWEMRKKGLETGWSNEEILRNINESATELGGLVKAERMARLVKDYFDDLVGWTADEGMLTRAEANKMIEEWQTYVPLQRYHALAMRSGTGMGGGLRKLKGGIEEVGDPLEAMVQVTLGIVRQVHRHKSLDALYQMGRKFPKTARLVEEIPPDQLPKEFEVAEVLKAIEKQVELPGERQHELEYQLDSLREVLGEDAAVNLMLFRPNYQINKNYPILMHRTAEGKKVWLQVDKPAFEALQSVVNPDAAAKAAGTLESVTRHPLLRAPTSVVKWFATGVNTTFAAFNMWRDAALFSGYSKVPRSMLPWSGVYYWTRGVKRILTGGKDSEIAEINSIFRAMGGEGLTYFSREIKRMWGSQQLLPKEARVPRELTPRGLLSRARNVLESTIGKVVDLGERALRFDEFVEVYKAAVKAGKSESHAALEALEATKEVTINFTRSGMLSGPLNNLIPYFNAGMQGMRKNFRAFSGADGSRAMKASWINLASTVGTLSAIEHWWHGDEEWYQDLADWQRFSYWHFKIGNQVIEIPKPHLPAYAVTSVFDQLFSQNKMTGKEILGEGFQQLVIDHLAMPSLISPFIEWTTNYSMWKGRSIVPEHLQRSRIGPDQFNSYTQEWAKWASRVAHDTFGLEFSPMKLENAGNQILGSMPSRMERMVGGLGNMLGFELDPERSDTLDQIPVLNSFLRHHAHRGSRAVNDFYEISRDLKKRSGSGTLPGSEEEALAETRILSNRLQALRELRDQGAIKKEDFSRMRYEVVAPFVKNYRRRQ